MRRAMGVWQNLAGILVQKDIDRRNSQRVSHFLRPAQIMKEYEREVNINRIGTVVSLSPPESFSARERQCFAFMCSLCLDL